MQNRRTRERPSLSRSSRLIYLSIVLGAIAVLLATLPSMLGGAGMSPPPGEPPASAQAPATPALGEPPASARALAVPPPLGEPPASAQELASPAPAVGESTEPIPSLPAARATARASSDRLRAEPTAGPAREATSPGTTAVPGAWQLVFHDEFDGPALDTSKWTPSFWWGNTHGNRELQAYSPNNLEFSGGILRLRVDKRSTDGFPHSSGMISSHGKFNQEFGLFEMRARVPRGMGLWAAFWLAPDKRAGVTWPPEIDVMETRGHDTELLSMTHHYLNSNGKHAQKNGSHVGPDLSAGFHTFSLVWNPDVSVWYLDGVEVWQSRTDRARGPMYLIANLAVGDWAGPPNSATPFPSYFDIDYIRVYQR